MVTCSPKMRGVRLVRSLAAVVRPAARAAVLPMRIRALHVSVPALASEADFQRAKAAVEKLSSRPSNDVLLRLYSLYKQATEGPNKTPEPGMFNIVAKAKWKAWAELGSMSAEEARQQYIDTVKVRTNRSSEDDEQRSREKQRGGEEEGAWLRRREVGVAKGGTERQPSRSTCRRRAGTWTAAEARLPPRQRPLPRSRRLRRRRRS